MSRDASPADYSTFIRYFKTRFNEAGRVRAGLIGHDIYQDVISAEFLTNRPRGAQRWWMDYRIDSRELDGNNVTLSGLRRRGDPARQLVIMHKGASVHCAPASVRYGHANEHIMRIEL